ncbi:MAG: hypothetical protein ACLRI7_07615 [Ruthenibacterium lactatiformans]
MEVTRADLVGRYVVHTAHHTGAPSSRGRRAVHRRSIQPPRKGGSFGLEAGDTLVKGMEDLGRSHRVLAGYSKEMAEFLTANSGLAVFQTS